MELINYLRCNEDTSHEIEPHRRLLNDISSKLVQIGIYSPEHTFREVNLLCPKGRIVGQVDLIVIDTYGDVYLIEAKRVENGASKNLSRRRGKSREQLKRAYSFLRDKFGVCPHQIGVYRVKGSNKLNHFRLNRPLDDILN